MSASLIALAQGKDSAVACICTKLYSLAHRKAIPTTNKGNSDYFNRIQASGELFEANKVAIRKLEADKRFDKATNR